MTVPAAARTSLPWLWPVRFMPGDDDAVAAGQGPGDGADPGDGGDPLEGVVVGARSGRGATRGVTVTSTVPAPAGEVR